LLLRTVVEEKMERQSKTRTDDAVLDGDRWTWKA